MIHRPYELLQRSGHLLGLLLTFFGSFFQLLYLSNVENFPFIVIEMGVAMIVVGIILSYKMLRCNVKAEPFFLLSVYFMFFALTIMLFVRFNAFSGVDNLREYKAAEITLTQGWNTPDSIQLANAVGAKPYLSCLSITVSPAVFSKVSGMDLTTIFKFGLTTIVCLKPILVYLNVREVFGRRELAALSAIIYSQLYFIFYTFNTRHSIAAVFLLCALLVFFKLIRTEKKTYLSLLCVFIFGIVVSHYTGAYFYEMMFFVLALTLYTASKSGKKGLSLLKIDLWKGHIGFYMVSYVCVFFLILSSAWFLFVPTSPFFQHVQIIAHSFAPHIPLPELGEQTTYILGSPLGPLIDNWFRFEVVLAIAGFLLLALATKKDLRMFLWLSAGGFFFACFLLSFIPHAWVAFGEFTRVYRLGFPFFSVFIALILLRLDKRSKGLVLILFLLLNLPMNMLLPIHNNYVLYHPKEVVSPERAVGQAYVDEAEFGLSRWTRNHVPTNDIILVDSRGRMFLYYTNNPLFNFMDPLTFRSRYLVLHYFSITYGLFNSRGSIEMRSDQVTSLINSNNVIYCNGQNMMLYGNITNNP